MIFDYLVYILFGLIPSFLWLYFYLKKDSHPEPKLKILEVFCGGILAAIIAAIVETLVLKKVVTFAFPSSFFRLISIFIIIALIEETLKYLVVYLLVLNDSEFDEPIDLFVYLIVSALGFAALENTFLFFSENMQILETIIISSLRFVGATFLHALCSGIFASLIAISFCKRGRRITFAFFGFLSAVVLHSLYNLFIIRTNGLWRFVVPTLFLAFLAGILSLFLNKLKKMKSVCETEEKLET